MSIERFLLDTHLLIDGAYSPEKLSKKAQRALDQESSLFTFSVASLWEITIKRGLNRSGFQVDPHMLRARLFQRGMQELEVTAAHAMSVAKLPMLHGDPFDRLLLSQATVENLTFLTLDKLIGGYGGPVRLLR